MMKKRLALLLAAAMTISAGVCTVYAENEAAEEKGELMMATTTSTVSYTHLTLPTKLEV